MVDDLDEAGRPRPSGDVELRPDQMGPGEHLRVVHDHLRAEVTQLAELADEVVGEQDRIGEVARAVEDLSMRENFDRFGTFCAMTCRMLNMHHRIEDLHVFPAIARDEFYGPLAQKLSAEHDVIHEKLIAVDAALAGVQQGAEYVPLRDAIHDLKRALFSHLQYEDEQLPEPLGVLGLGA